MKDIKIVSYENFPFGGAPANFLRFFSFSLSSDDTGIEVILPTGNVYGKNIELKNQKKGKIDNVKYKHLGFKIHPQNIAGKFIDNIVALFFTPIYLFFSNLKKPFDLIISYNTHISRIFHLILIKIILRKKLILILPEFYEKPKNNILALFHWYDFYWGLKYFAKYADAYISVSHYMQNYIAQELKISKPNYILPSLLNPEVFVSKQQKEFKQGRITIGYTGTPTRKDGVIDLIKSFAIINKKYNNTHLLIIGDVINGNSVIPKLKEMAIELGCNDNITFTGLVPFNKIPDYLNSCQILTLTRPSGIFAEAGFPTKLGEYFACKKPVLITRVGDISLYLKNEEHAIIVNPNDIDNIAEGFEKLILDNNLVKKISNNGFIWMNNNLNYKKVSYKLRSFINNL